MTLTPVSQVSSIVPPGAVENDPDRQPPRQRLTAGSTNLHCCCGTTLHVTAGLLTPEVVRMFCAGHSDTGHTITEETT